MTALDTALAGVKSAVNDFYDDITGFFGEISTGVAGIFKSIGVPPGTEEKETVNAAVSPGQLSDSQHQQIVDNNNEGNYDASVDILVEAGSDTDPAELRILMEYLQNTVAGSTTYGIDTIIIDDPYETGAFSDTPTEKDYTFKEVGTVEELEAEFASISRNVTEIVTHWTESYSNANLDAKMIDERQKLLGESGIQYHYIIKRDGTLQRGAEINKETNHSRHKRYTIAVAFVGGYNTATHANNFEFNTGVRSLNRVQFNTYDQILRVFYNNYPGGQVVGHNDIEEEHEDPGFDVLEYCYNKFGKQTKFDNPFTQDPFSPEEINDN